MLYGMAYGRNQFLISKLVPGVSGANEIGSGVAELRRTLVFAVWMGIRPEPVFDFEAGSGVAELLRTLVFAVWIGIRPEPVFYFSASIQRPCHGAQKKAPATDVGDVYTV